MCTLGIKAVFKPSNTLRQSLVHVNKRLPEEKKRSVVYQVPCKGIHRRDQEELKDPIG